MKSNRANNQGLKRSGARTQYVPVETGVPLTGKARKAAAKRAAKRKK